MALPKFLIIGVVKAGSTGIYKAICQHPNAKIAKIKEIHFFDKDYIWRKGIKYYESVLGKCAEGEITGESTPMYIKEYDKVIPRIKQLIPNVKLIVSFRNPVKRAYSHICMHYRWIKDNNLEPLPSFEKYIDNYLDQFPNPEKAKDMIIRGHYAEQLKEWFKRFPREQIKVIKAEDFFKDANKITNEIFEFIGLSPFEVQNYNPNKGVYPAPMSERFKKLFMEYYKPLNKELYDLLDRDFGWEDELESK